MAFERFAKVRRDPDLLDYAKSVGFNEPELQTRAEAEATGTATWAQWDAAAANNRGDLSLQVDVGLAITNALALT